jgi:ribosomal protein S12 methylthiotransferase
MQNTRIGLISLGCAKNTIDSEVMLGFLKNAGFGFTSAPREADIILINTCAFVEEARKESIEAILEMEEIKKENPDKKIIVTGCFSQRYWKEMVKEIPAVDAWIGCGELEKVASICSCPINGKAKVCVEKPTFLYDDKTPRLRIDPGPSASVKIAEGCDNSCSYCAIPQIRGRFRSRQEASVIREAGQLAASGVREINLLAQDSTRYGTDRKEENALIGLLLKLASVDGIGWVRLMYAHPDRITPKLLDLIASRETICSYLDIPLQHVHPDILLRMGRLGDPDTLLDLIRRMQSYNITLRTTLMVGFPGETEKEFDTLYDFVEEARIDRLGVFVYSREEGTPAWRYGDPVLPEVKEERRGRLLELQRGISRRKNEALVGSQCRVLAERAEASYLVEARMEGQAPEVDGCVYINKGEVNLGEFCLVRITQAHDYDLVAEPVSQ